MKGLMVYLVAVLMLAGGRQAYAVVTLTDEAFIPGIEQPNNYSSVMGVTLSQDGARLYAAYWSDTSSDPIAIYNTVDNSLLDTPMSYGRCHGNVALSQNERFAYAPSYYEGDVSRIDLQNGNARTSLTIGSWATRAEMTPDKKTLLVHYNNSSLDPWVNAAIGFINVDGDTFQAVAPALSLGHPVESQWATTFSTDGRYAYVASCRSTTEAPTLFEINLANHSISRSLAMPGDQLEGIAVAKGMLYVGGGDQDKVYVVDITTFTKLTEEINVQYPVGDLTLNPDGENLFALHPNNAAISVIDINSSSVSLFDNLPDIKTPNDIAFSADGRKAYIAEMYNHGGDALGGVAVLDVAPEPSTIVLLGIGAISLLGYAWRRRHRAA